LNNRTVKYRNFRIGVVAGLAGLISTVPIFAEESTAPTFEKDWALPNLITSLTWIEPGSFRVNITSQP
jgi:hypothetical protein